MFQDQYSKLTIIYIFQDQEPLNLILIVQDFSIYCKWDYNIDKTLHKMSYKV